MTPCKVHSNTDATCEPSSQIFTLSSLGFSESLDDFAMPIPCHSDHYLHICRIFEHQPTN